MVWMLLNFVWMLLNFVRLLLGDGLTLLDCGLYEDAAFRVGRVGWARVSKGVECQAEIFLTYCVLLKS